MEVWKRVRTRAFRFSGAVEMSLQNQRIENFQCIINLFNNTVSEVLRFWNRTSYQEKSNTCQSRPSSEHRATHAQPRTVELEKTYRDNFYTTPAFCDVNSTRLREKKYRLRNIFAPCLCLASPFRESVVECTWVLSIVALLLSSDP